MGLKQAKTEEEIVQEKFRESLNPAILILKELVREKD